jgi:hypothetical protein
MHLHVRVLALAIFLGLLAAAPASAGQIVYSSNDNILVANGDGSGVRTLLTPADVPGATSLYNVHVDPNGSKVVFSARTPYSGGIFCGFNCVGVYALDGDQLSRVSGRPIGCSGDPCLGLDVDPKITADGARVFYERIYGEPGGQYGTPQTISNSYVAPAVENGASQEVELSKDAVGASCVRPGSFVPNPANQDEFAWVDCWPDFNSNLSSALRVGNQTIGGDDYYELVGIAWRPDGQQLVTVENGEDKGIWLYNRDGSGTPQHVLQVGAWDDINSQSSVNPTFVGNDRIAYYWNGEIRTVSASCDRCAPDQGSPLLASPDGDGLAWTSRTLPVIQRGGGDTGGGTTPGGTTTPGGDNGANRGNTGGTQVVLTPRGVKLATALKGLTVPFQAPGAGTLSLMAQLDAKTAKKLKLIKKGTKPVKVATGKATPKAAGNWSAKLKFTKAAIKRLKKAKSLKLKLVGTFKPAAGGSVQSVSATVTLKR